MLERDVRREVSAADRRRAERVGVEVQLERVGGHRVRDGGQTAPRAVDDTARRVAETRLRTRRRRRRRGGGAAVAGRRLRQVDDERRQRRPQEPDDHRRGHGRRPRSSSRRRRLDDAERRRHAGVSRLRVERRNVTRGLPGDRRASQTAADVDDHQLRTVQPKMA